MTAQPVKYPLHDSGKPAGESEGCGFCVCRPIGDSESSALSVACGGGLSPGIRMGFGA
jgi:hypothetical protein